MDLFVARATVYRTSFDVLSTLRDILRTRKIGVLIAHCVSRMMKLKLCSLDLIKISKYVRSSLFDISPLRRVMRAEYRIFNYTLRSATS